MSRLVKTGYKESKNMMLNKEKGSSRNSSRNKPVIPSSERQYMLEKDSEDLTIYKMMKKIQIQPIPSRSTKSRNTQYLKYDKSLHDKRPFTRQAIHKQPNTDYEAQCVERPQSKQQSRIKMNQNVDLTSSLMTERPQTSKGTRNLPSIIEKQQPIIIDRFETEKISKQIDKILVKKKQLKHPMSAATYRTEAKRKLNFQTSIDPQFLSLFANN